jgi:hypothetical protein
VMCAIVNYFKGVITMANLRIDLNGRRFGSLLVLNLKKERGRLGEVQWDCICDCGKERVTSTALLANGISTSCGCKSYETRKKHGMTNTRTFKSWDSMKQRCINPNDPSYAKYGARGITICKRWVESFNNFLADMGERPEGKSIDRIDVNGNYEPLNCRWATRSEQQRNKTNSVFLEWQGEKKSTADWADIVGIPRKIICDRISAGWSIEDALTKPNRKAKKLQGE